MLFVLIFSWTYTNRYRSQVIMFVFDNVDVWMKISLVKQAPYQSASSQAMNHGLGSTPRFCSWEEHFITRIHLTVAANRCFKTTWIQTERILFKCSSVLKWWNVGETFVYWQSFSLFFHQLMRLTWESLMIFKIIPLQDQVCYTSRCPVMVSISRCPVHGVQGAKGLP